MWPDNRNGRGLNASSKELERVFKKNKIRVETGAKCDNVQKTGTSVKMKVTLANGKVEDVEAEKLLVAVGRTIVALLENGQRADGSVVLPECLTAYGAPAELPSAIRD